MTVENTTTRPQRRARKRAHGEGSVFKRASDGLWVGSALVGMKPDGKPDRRSVYGKTQAEALTKLDALRQRANQGTVVSRDKEKLTVGEFLERWLDVTEGTVRPSTMLWYRRYTTTHLIPALGRYKLSALRPDHLQRLYADKRKAVTVGDAPKRALAPRSIHHLHAIMRRALHQAVRWGFLARNVAEAVDPPQVPRTEVHPPIFEELRALLQSAREAGDSLQALWCVAIYSGCRRGELLGLTWPDVDFERGAIAIRRTLLGAEHGAPLLGEPKTASGRRVVTLPPPAMDALRQHRARQLEDRAMRGADYAPYDLVFCTGLGTALLGRNVIRSFKAALKRAGLPASVRIHDLRHAAATLMLQAGVPDKVASARLGHSQVGITRDLYSHVMPSMERDAAAKLAQALDHRVASS